MNERDGQESVAWLFLSIMSTVFGFSLCVILMWWVWSAATATTKGEGLWYDFIIQEQQEENND